ncbi:MAG: alkyl hydroperoxide reductase [Phycisphaeraceae bacterium]
MTKGAGSPRWMSVVLWLAAGYNLVWGAAAVLFPVWFFEMAGMDAPLYPWLWQCVGMIVGVYGIGYGCAALDPARHWPIVLVGLLGKVFGPIGFAQALWMGEITPAFGVNIIFNDLIWWVPFTLILVHAWRVQHRVESAG